jgi:hypothetical protein
MDGSDQLQNFRAMTNYIKDNSATKALYDLINKDDRYKRIRDRCNNNTHYTLMAPRQNVIPSKVLVLQFVMLFLKEM